MDESRMRRMIKYERVALEGREKNKNSNENTVLCNVLGIFHMLLQPPK